MEAHQVIPFLEKFAMQNVVAANDATPCPPAFPLLEAALHRPYRVRTGTIIKLMDDAGEIDICDAFEPIALAREEDSSNWSLLVEFDDPDGILKTVQISLADLQQDPKSIRARLASEGLAIRHRTAFDDMMQGLKPSARVQIARRPGWSSKRDSTSPPTAASAVRRLRKSAWWVDS